MKNTTNDKRNKTGAKGATTSKAVKTVKKVTRKPAAIARHAYFDRYIVSALLNLKKVSRYSPDALNEIAQAAMINGACSDIAIYSDGKKIVGGDWTKKGRLNICMLQTCINETVKLYNLIDLKAKNYGLAKDAELAFILAWVKLINACHDTRNFLINVFSAGIIYPQIKSGNINVYSLSSDAEIWGEFIGIYDFIDGKIEREQTKNIDSFIVSMLKLNLAKDSAKIAPPRMIEKSYYYDVTNKEGGKVNRFDICFSASNNDRLMFWHNTGTADKTNFILCSIATDSIVDIKISHNQED